MNDNINNKEIENIEYSILYVNSEGYLILYDRILQIYIIVTGVFYSNNELYFSIK